MSWELGSFLVLAVALALGFVWYERSRPPARVLALVAALAALAVVGRIAFAALPNVKPTTDIVLLSGYALGGAPGFAVGSIAALVSNVFFSQGPWTPWQMAAWGGVGLAGGALGAVARGERALGRWPLAVVCGLAGLAYGMVMDLYMWTVAGEHTLAAYVALSGRSLPFNVAHVLGNVAFCLLIGPPLVRALRRYRRRFEVVWSTRPPSSSTVTPATLALIGTVGALWLIAAPPAQATPVDRGTGFLISAQNPDGGYGSSAHGPSSAADTGWAALGLLAGGRNPRDVTCNGNSVLDYVERNVDELRDVGALERTILVVSAAGMNPRDFAGHDLVAQLRHARNRGELHDSVNWTAWEILALRAAGEDSGVSGSASWLADQQNPDDGGFSFSGHPKNDGPYPESDVDDTAAVIEALVAAGPDQYAQTLRRALGYLRARQDAAGGFPQMEGMAPNAQSTAWAVQAFAASRRGTSRALSYLRSLQAQDGSFRYSDTGDPEADNKTPVFVTGEVIPALVSQPFPLAPVGSSGQAVSGCPQNKESPKPAATQPASVTTRPSTRKGGRRSGAGGTGGGAGHSGAGTGDGPGSAGLAGARPRASKGMPSPVPSSSLSGFPSASALDSWRAFSDPGRLPLARTGGHGPRGPGDRSEGPGAIALLALAILAAAVVAATAGAARLRRLWAALRRRSA